MAGMTVRPSSWAARWASGTPSVVSWSDRAMVRTPQAWARRTSSVGLRRPSETVEWRCRSKLISAHARVIARYGLRPRLGNAARGAQVIGPPFWNAASAAGRFAWSNPHPPSPSPDLRGRGCFRTPPLLLSGEGGAGGDEVGARAAWSG